MDSVAIYTCHKDFTMESGTATHVCRSTGNWDGEKPTCKRAFCPDPGQVLNAVRTGTREIGSSITYSCTYGFALHDGGKSLTCTMKGIWKGRIPKCKEIKCDKPEPLVNAIVQVSGDTLDSVATYTCLKDFVIESGNDTRVCLSTGAWDGEKPACKRVSCPDPGYVLHSVRTGSFLVGESVEYTCKPGFTNYLDNNKITCTDEGTWEGKKPICEGVFCGNPGPIENATMVGSFRYGDNFNYLCLPGYKLYENGKMIYCEKNGSWIGYKPSCRPQDGTKDYNWLAGVVIGGIGIIFPVIIGVVVFMQRLKKRREHGKDHITKPYQEEMSTFQSKESLAEPIYNVIDEVTPRIARPKEEQSLFKDYEYVPSNEASYENSKKEGGYMTHKCDKACSHKYVTSPQEGNDEYVLPSTGNEDELNEYEYVSAKGKTEDALEEDGYLESGFSEETSGRSEPSEIKECHNSLKRRPSTTMNLQKDVPYENAVEPRMTKEFDRIVQHERTEDKTNDETNTNGDSTVHQYMDILPD